MSTYISQTRISYPCRKGRTKDGRPTTIIADYDDLKSHSVTFEVEAPVFSMSEAQLRNFVEELTAHLENMARGR